MHCAYYLCMYYTSSQYSVYGTRFTLGPAGVPVCIVNPPSGDDNQFGNIRSMGRNGQVKFLYSPGYLERVP